MRLSEKTIELNICSQLSLIVFPPIIWFGLTQREEARAGFDACTRLRGRLLLFQFKASNHDVNGMRRFQLNHDQLSALYHRCRNFNRTVYYVFPLIGNSYELAKDSCFITQTWLLDVSCLGSISPPTQKNGLPRKNRIHYADVRPGKVCIHSKPIEFILSDLEEFIFQSYSYSDNIRDMFSHFSHFWEFRKFLSRHSLALFIQNSV